MTTAIINQVERLRLKYPAEEQLVFKDLSLSIRHGEKVLLLGPSGSGKSTLMQVLSGLVPEAIQLPMKCDNRLVPGRWGYVFQDPDTQFCMPYVDEEIAFTLENLRVPRVQMPELIRNYVEKVGLKLPDLHTPIAELSQGMKQRLAIACALALEPDVLYLDEPTALLDPEGTALVWETIRLLPVDRTLLIVEHKVDEAMHVADRVVLFDENGTIVADDQAERFFQMRKESLWQSGIWYPGIWEDYDGTEVKEYSEERLTDEPVVQLQQFVGYRGKEAKIQVSDASIRRGDWISIVGPNGAGKSTLLLAMMRLIRTEGLCRIAGVETEKTVQIAKAVGFVFQNPELQFVTGTVLDELMFGQSLERSQEERLADAEKLLEKFGLEPYRDRHPYQLSIGQKRKLSVATAIGGGKTILLLDEPTFGLDARSTFQILEMLEELRRQGTAIMMVTHDPQIVERFSTGIWTIEAGQLKEAIRC